MVVVGLGCGMLVGERGLEIDMVGRAGGAGDGG